MLLINSSSNPAALKGAKTMKKIFLIFVAVLFFAFPNIAAAAGYVYPRTITLSAISDGQTAGVEAEAGASIFVIDLTKFKPYGGDVAIQIGGISVMGTPPADPTTGISIYWAANAQSSDADSATWDAAEWNTLIEGLLFESGPTSYVRGLESSVTQRASPYIAIKMRMGTDATVKSETSAFCIDLTGIVR
jgi:hypothetical protein